MFNDDSGDDEFDGLDELLHAYDQLKKGLPFQFIDEDEYAYIVDYFLGKNQENEALNVCEVALQYYPYSAPMLLLKAELLFQGQKHGQALHTLDELDGYSQGQLLLDSVLLRSDIFLAQHKYEYAARFLEGKISEFQGREQVEIMLELSDVYDECQEFKSVFGVLKRVIEIDPFNEEALHKISFWADFAEMQDESIELHLRIIEDDPYNALAWFNLGTAYQGKKDYKNAIEAYEYCVAIDEKFEVAYRNVADAYIRLNWYDKAIESLEKNLALGKPEDVIFEAMGHCFEKQRKFDKARHYYRQAIELSPSDDSIFFRIGQTYSRENQWEKAAKSYCTALTLNKENANYFLALGDCLMQLEAHNDAFVCYLNALRLKPNNKTNWIALIKALIVTEDYDDALIQIANAEEAVGEKPDFDYYHAAILFAMGKTKEAMIHLENALEKAPNRLKILMEIQPELLQRKSVANLVAQYKKKK